MKSGEQGHLKQLAVGDESVLVNVVDLKGDCRGKTRVCESKWASHLQNNPESGAIGLLESGVDASTHIPTSFACPPEY